MPITRSARGSLMSSKKSIGAASFLCALLLLAPAGKGDDVTADGFITSWLLLGPYLSPGNGVGTADADYAAPGIPVMRQDYLTDGATVFETNFFPFPEAIVASSCDASGGPSCYLNPDTSLTTPTVESVDSTTVSPIFATPAITTEPQNTGGSAPDPVNLTEFWGGMERAAVGIDPVGHVMAYAITYVKNATGKDLAVVGQ